MKPPALRPAVISQYARRKLFARKHNFQGDPYGTHQPYLESCLTSMSAESKDGLTVVEVGVGLYSTTLLSSLLSRLPGSRLISIESDSEWTRHVQTCLTPSGLDHQWIEISPLQSWWGAVRKASSGTEIDLAFIDSNPWESRSIALEHFRDLAKVTVVHDCDYFPHRALWGDEKEPIVFENGMSEPPTELGVRDYSTLFSSWVEIFPEVFSCPTGPPTLFGSNKVDVRNLFADSRPRGTYISGGI